jgi:uncharacterized protein (TIRG00374 family)
MTARGGNGDHLPHPAHPGAGWGPRLRLGLGLALSALCLFLAVRKISLAAFQQALSTANWEWTALAVVAYIASTSLKAVRWQGFFLPLRVPLRTVWPVFLVGQLLNLVLPLRAGEVGRIYLISEEDSEVNWPAALSTIAVEKVVDLVMLALAFLIVALWLATTPTGLPDWLQTAGRALIPLMLLALTGLVMLAFYGQAAWRILRRGFKPLPPRWNTRLNTWVEQALAGLESLRHRPARLRAWGWSLLIWSIMALTNALLFRAFDLRLSPFVALLLLVVLMSAVSAPRLPGNQGVLVYLCVLVLSLFGVGQEAALLYGITLQGVIYLPLIVLGLIALLWTSRSLPTEER